MAHEAKDYRRLVGECRGFLSETQLQAHFELYQGYVKKLNEIESMNGILEMYSSWPTEEPV